jgi:hypothetical protein
MSFTRFCTACCVVGLLLVSSQDASATLTWNVVTDFSSTNPSSAWTYGWANSTACGANSAYVDANNSYSSLVGGAGRLCGWRYDGSTVDPSAVRNFTSSDIDMTSVWGFVIHPDSLLTFPGWSSTWGYASVVKFTAPTAGSYSINLTTSHQSTDNGTSWAEVYQNMTTLGSGTQLVSQYMSGSDSLTYSATLALGAGDTISLVNNGKSQYTGGLFVSGTIGQVPEPSAALLTLCGGLVGLLCYAWRKRTRTPAC